MMDTVWLLVGVGVFGLSWGLVELLGHLKAED